MSINEPTIAEGSSSATRTHPAVLKTKTQYAVPFEKYMIPTTWRRFHLSQLINKVLALPQPVPFDFIINGEMLRASLGDWCSVRGMGEEETLEIEYIESVLPAEKQSSMPHPDWVSSISCHLKGYFLTGSYDSTVRLFNDKMELLYLIPGHRAPVSSVCVIPKPADAMMDDPNCLIASASYDTTARIVSVPLDLLEPDSPQAPRPLASLHLHTSALSSIACNSSGKTLLTGGWDTLIGVWTTDIPDSDEVEELHYGEADRSKKRRKVRKDFDADVPIRKAPQAVLKSHTSRVSSVRWSPVSTLEPNLAYSCGWDFTMRGWDVEAGVCTSTQTAAERAMLDLAITANGKTIVTANGDRTASIFQIGSPAPPSQLPHSAPVMVIAAHPTSSNHIASGCMDGTVRIWDLRSTKGAVESFVAAGEQEPTEGPGKAPERSKVLSLDWSRGVLLGCAGEKGVDLWKVNVGNR